jgi:hypothetical protein
VLGGMRIMLMAHGPKGVTDALTWTGEVDWPGVPPVGSGVRVPTSAIGGDLLEVARGIYEPDGSVYLIMKEVDDALSQKLRFEYGWSIQGK